MPGIMLSAHVYYLIKPHCGENSKITSVQADVIMETQRQSSWFYFCGGKLLNAVISKSRSLYLIISSISIIK